MTRLTLRTRLMGGAVLGIGLSALAPTSAMAACNPFTNITPNDGIQCVSNTTTTDTTAPTNVPNDRNYQFDTTSGSRFLYVDPGVVVNGFGLAATNVGGGAFNLVVQNAGTVQVDAPNSPTAGGPGALFVSAIGATNVVYTGPGNVINNNGLLGAAGDALSLLQSGTGNITATVGGNLATTGLNTFGIWARQTGTAGNIAITTTAGKTILVGEGGSGIVASITNATSTGNLSITNAANIGSNVAPLTIANGIVASNSGLGTVTVANTGTIGGSADRVSGTGIGASISNATSTSAVSVTGSGAIWTSGTGIRATNSGTGAVTVNYTGPINSTGAFGINTLAAGGATTVTTGAGAVSATGAGGVAINVAGTTGATTVTTGTGAITGADYGIQVATTGTQTINANGVTTGTAISGIHSNTTAARTINVGTAGNVTGATQAILIGNTGAATVNNSGIIGAAATGLAVNATGAGATTINNASAGTINGRLTLSGNGDTLANSGTWNTQGVTDFGAGTDTLTNNASGVVNLTGAATFANVETINQNGRINLNTFTLTGPAVAFTNGSTGYIDTSGSAGLAGFTSLSNAGAIDLAAGTFTAPTGLFTNSGTILADEGASTITGQTGFTNSASGVLDLSDGVANDTLTINSAYTGGGTLFVDTSQTASDLLVLTGAVSGVTTVDVNLLSPVNFALNQRVVDAAAASSGAFVIGDVFGASPLADLTIVQSGQDYFVNAVPTEAAFEPLAVANLASDFWYQSADEVIAQTRLPVITTGFGAWGQIYGSIDKTGENDLQVINGLEYDADNKLDTTRYGIQGGVDFGFAGARLGLTGGWAKAEADGIGEYTIDGWNIGLYGQFGGELGFHGEALVKYDKFDIEFDDGVFVGAETDGSALGGDLALGYRFAAGNVPIVDLNAGLSHVRTKIDDVSAFGFGYDYSSITSTRARGGVRAYFGGGWRPYIDATVYHEFDGEGDIELFDGVNAYDLRTAGKGTWVRLEGGLGGKPNSGPILAVWGDVGDRKGVGIRLGFRFGGAAQEVLPPPPPPVVEPVAPPPPPPATQTCPDGSVILATEACPPPPPPPPPAPEPERG